MLQGNQARYYRLVVSGVTIEELSQYMNEDDILTVENEAVNADQIIVARFYGFINDIKRNRIYPGSFEPTPKENIQGENEIPPQKKPRRKKN